MAKNGKPYIPNIEAMLAAGIDPKTNLPAKLASSADLKGELKKALRIIDQQDACNRYVWYNLPMNLTSQELERLLYYKYNLVFFYIKELDEFYFMPYALEGSIDFYSRYKTVHPVPIANGTTDDEKKLMKAQADYLSTVKLNVVYGVKLPEDLKEEDLYKSGVILRDYTNQLSQTGLSRQSINDAILDLEAECLPYMRTAMVLGSGVKGLRVNDGDAANNAVEAARSMHKAALNGIPYVPIQAQVEFQDLTDGSLTKIEDYTLAMQSIENFRLSTYGIDQGGLFEKKTQELQSEADLNGGPVGLVLQDGLSLRQNFCNIVNSIWNLGIWCEPAENIVRTDMDGDGMMYDRNDDSTNSGIDAQGSTEGGTEDVE